jgi:uncharacterized protein YbjT (DUF2867 family)
VDTSELLGVAALEALRGKRLLLAGATGRNGRVVLRQLLQLGVAVRATSRDPAAAAKATPGAEWVAADVTDAGSLEAAMRGIDVASSAVATASPLGRNKPERVDYLGNVNFARAARAAGVKRIVAITSSVSGREGGLFNLLLNNVLVWKGKGERALIDSGLEYVIVGPAGMNDEPGGVKRIVLQPRADYVRGSSVTRDETASVCIAAAALPEAANRVFSVSNQAAPADDAWRAAFAQMPRD